MKVEIKVKGMMCEHCKKRVENALSASGFTACADISTGIVTVEGENTDISVLKTVIEDLGFDFIG